MEFSLTEKRRENRKSPSKDPDEAASADHKN
jgi:hypothetical protein